MNFVSLIALALGMIASTDAAAPRPAFASAAVHRRTSAARRVVREIVSGRVVWPRDVRASVRAAAVSAVRRLVAPLTGAAAPRAPAVRG
jgi:hypothetical protein